MVLMQLRFCKSLDSPNLLAQVDIQLDQPRQRQQQHEEVQQNADCTQSVALGYSINALHVFPSMQIPRALDRIAREQRGKHKSDHGCDQDADRHPARKTKPGAKFEGVRRPHSQVQEYQRHLVLRRGVKSVDVSDWEFLLNGVLRQVAIG